MWQSKGTLIDQIQLIKLNQIEIVRNFNCSFLYITENNHKYIEIQAVNISPNSHAMTLKTISTGFKKDHVFYSYKKHTTKLK